MVLLLEKNQPRVAVLQDCPVEPDCALAIIMGFANSQGLSNTFSPGLFSRTIQETNRDKSAHMTWMVFARMLPDSGKKRVDIASS